MSKKTSLVLAMLCLLLAAPVVASAQQQEAPIYTSVALWNVPRAQWADFTAFWEKNGRPVLERMYADGTIVSWGRFATVVHEENGYTHGTWYAATSIAALQRVLEELLKLPPNPAAAGAKHRDHLFRSLIHRGRATGPTSGYVSVAAFQVQPGRGGEWLDLWKRYFQSMYDEWLANGTISMYEVEVEQIHTESPNWRYIVTVAPKAEALDKMTAGIGVLFEKNPTLGAAFAPLSVPGAHWDYLARVVAFAQK